MSDELTRWALAWLDDSEARSLAKDSLVRLRSRVAEPGASDRGASISPGGCFKTPRKVTSHDPSRSKMAIAVPTGLIWSQTLSVGRNQHHSDERFLSLWLTFW